MEEMVEREEPMVSLEMREHPVMVVKVESVVEYTTARTPIHQY